MSSRRPRVFVVGDTGEATGWVGDAVRCLSLACDVESGVSLPQGLNLGGFDAVLVSPDGIMRLGPPAAQSLTSDAAAVLDAIGEGICVSDSTGAVRWANERFRSYDEQTKARIASVCRQAAERLEDQLSEPGAPGGHESLKYEVASGDDQRCLEVLVSPVGIRREADGGDGLRVAAVVWDVTSSRRTQLKMDAIDRAGAELVRLDADSIRRMNAGERLQVLEEKIIKFSHDLMHFDHFSIRLLDTESGRLELVMSSGLPSEAMEAEVHASREGNGIMGYVAATGRSYLCPDVARDRRYRQGLRGARSALTVPIRFNDTVIGVFNVESELPNGFTEEDRQFAEMFATHIALAIHILDLLVKERCTTGANVSDRVTGELNEPLQDILHEAEWLKSTAGRDPTLRSHIDRISADVEAIRRRVREVAQGPQTILGAERAISEGVSDPLISGRRILVADDEPRIRQIIRDLLRARGGNVVTCDDGVGAIAELELSIAARDGDAKRRFDLVISDIKMPDRNGYEVFAAARAADTDVPVILMTGFGYDPHHSIVRASQEGLQCVLFKPFQAERLLDEVRKALSGERAAR